MKLLKESVDRSPLTDFLIKKMGTLGLIFFACYITYTNHPSIKRFEDSVFRYNIPIQEKYYPDPAGLTVDIKINKDGYKKGYLTHKDSGFENEVMADGGLETYFMLDCVKNRSKIFNKSETKQTLEYITEIQKNLYENLLRRSK